MTENKLTMKKDKVQPFQVRLPMKIYNQVVKYRSKRPHVSLNAFMIEAVIRFLEDASKDEKAN